MPRTTKEKNNNLEKEKEKKTSTKATSTSSKTRTKKSATTVKEKSTKKTTTKVSDKKPKTKKVETKKVSKTTKKVAKSTSSKTAKKSVSSRKTTSKKKPLLAEYYDLPYKYNQTIVKILAQTPSRLFVYWEISDDDKNTFIKKYGDNFFDVTKPVLIIHNLTMNYSFELDINDFANSWYFNINDADCLYGIELGRRPLPVSHDIHDSYIYISSSNDLQAPNNHILFENINENTVFKFKNVKTNYIETKTLKHIPFFTMDNKVYNFNVFYKKLYGENILKDLADTKLNNPSSGSISSFK